MPQVNSVYIHIPFCESICSYCDFCKMLYNNDLVNRYLCELKQEVTKLYQGDTIKTIYIGGGSPSVLNLEQLEVLRNIINVFNVDNDYEFTIELNVSDIDEEKLLFYKSMGVNRISIGIETINDKFLHLLNRSHTKDEVINKINLVKKYFSNINVDFMYGFFNQTFGDLKLDLEFFKDLNINHISIYSLMLEPNTKLYINNTRKMEEALENKMYYYIIDYLEDIGFKHYEISNFAKDGYSSKHNLVYWNNERYYGFGLGASGYVANTRYTNTRSISNYLNGKHLLEKDIITRQIDMENEMILGFRKIEGVNKKIFFDKFNCQIQEVFDITELLGNNMLVDGDDNLFIPKDKLYIQNGILVNFIGGSSSE